MTHTTVDAATFWAERMALVTDAWRAEIRQIIMDAEPRRAKAKFNTGSISGTAALALRAICAWVQPRVVVEVGTFIGVSTFALQASEQLYTCDVSNNCVESSARVQTFPYRTSTAMLSTLAAHNVSVDVFFFDGLLSVADIPLVLELSTSATVYVFDDYNSEFKGVQNVRRLVPILPRHVLMPAAGPVQDDTTLAALVPESLL